MTIVFRHAARTDVGYARAGNEDSGFAASHLLAVADGVGGQAFGELASALTIATIRDAYVAGSFDSPAAVARAVAEANERIAERVRHDPKTAGMGTTLTVLLLFEGDRLGVVHIGDSRAYMYREGELTQLSSDHTVLQELLDAGRLRPEQADRFPYRNVVTRSMHGRPESEPDVGELAVGVGDRLLVCSDGLTDVVTPADIAHAIADAGDVVEAAETLVRLALDGGGPDNVTCLVGEVVESTAAPAAPAAAEEDEGVSVGAVTELSDGSGSSGSPGANRPGEEHEPDEENEADSSADDGGGRPGRLTRWLRRRSADDRPGHDQGRADKG